YRSRVPYGIRREAPRASRPELTPPSPPITSLGPRRPLPAHRAPRRPPPQTRRWPQRTPVTFANSRKRVVPPRPPFDEELARIIAITQDEELMDALSPGRREFVRRFGIVEGHAVEIVGGHLMC